MLKLRKIINMFNNTYSPVGSPVKKNIGESSSPSASPLKHPRTDFATTFSSSYTPASQVVGSPIEIIQGKLSSKLKLLIFTSTDKLYWVSDAKPP